MDALAVSAASGIRARMESLEMLANNIANQSAAGYKTDREFYSLYVTPDAYDSTGDTVVQPPTLPVVERHWTDFSQGTLTSTGNQLNLAISGKAFFTVQGPSGTPLYTRNGDFRLSADGGLETQQGYAVLDSAGRPIEVDPALPVEFTRDGAVKQGGALLAKMGLAEFKEPNQLAKHAGTYFRTADSQIQPVAVTESEIHQGTLEASNLTGPEAAVRLISVMRQSEMLHKALALGTEMNRKAVEEVARVGS